MAGQQQTYLQAGRQHLARHQQEASVLPAVSVHQHQQALVAVQDLERQRMQLHQQALAEAALEAHLQQRAK